MEWTRLLAVLLLLEASQVTGMFHCEDGSESVYETMLCNGVKECRDGSDEAPVTCDAITNARPLAVGERVTALVDHMARHEWIYIMVCNASSCSEVGVYGASPAGELWHETYTGCNHTGWGGCDRVSLVIPDGAIDFAPGRLWFTVERRPGELSVWIEGHPQYPVSVPVKEDQTLLRVRYWGLPLRVQYQGEEHPTYHGNNINEGA